MSDDTRPDTYTLSWWREQMRGVVHSLNRCTAEYADCFESVKTLRERADKAETKLDTELAAFRVEIGRLKEELAVATEAIGKAREAFRELKKEKP